jgi:hypothetical protein
VSTEPLTVVTRRRRRWVVPVVVAVAVPGLALSAVSTWAVWQIPVHRTSAAAGSGSGPRTASGSGLRGAADTLARGQAEDAILIRRGDAVRAHDEARFLADLDPTDASLRAQQKAVFAGLAKIDFSSFGYATNGIGYDRPKVTARYGVPTNIAAVVSTYQLKGYDTGPVVEAQAVTFVYRQGRWWFASDHDAESSLPAAGHAEPWDSGEASVVTGRRSLVIGESIKQSTLQRVATSVDGAVKADLKFWPAGHKDEWDGKVVVYVPKAQRDFSSLFAGTTQSADGVVAVTIPVYDNVEFRASGRAYGKVTGQRIIINPRYFKPTSSFFEVILRHEISHAAAAPITGDGTPSWLVEGLAEYVGWRQPDNPSQTFFDRGVDRLTARKIDSRTYHLKLPASSTFYSGSPAAIAARYTTGFLVCAYIQHQYGEGRLKIFAQRMGKATSPAKEPAVLRSALRKTFGLTRSQLEDDATSWLRQYQIRH